MSALDEMFEYVRKANKALEEYYSPRNNGTVYNIAYNMTRADVTDPAAAELAALRARVEASISPEELAHALGIEYDNAKSSAFYLMMVKQYRFHYEAGKKA